MSFELASVETWLFALVVVFFAEVIYVALGFGAGMVALGGLVLATGEPQSAVVILLILNVPVQIWVMLRDNKRRMRLSRWPIAVGVVLGVPFGTHVLKAWGSRELLMTLGAVLISSAVLFFFSPRVTRSRLPYAEPAVGLMSGALGGAFGTGATPLIFYFQWIGLGRSEFRRSMMAMFFVGSVVRLPAYAATGLFTEGRLFSAIALAPAVVAGLLVGQRVHLGLGESLFRRTVVGGLAAIGLFLVVRHGY